LIGLLPWLEPTFAIPGAVVAFYGFRALRRARRPVLAVTALEVVGFSVALYVGLSEGLYGGPTPFAAALPGEAPVDIPLPGGLFERAYRFVALWIDRDYGLLRWAPVLALAVVGGLVLWRERRSGLARAIPGLRGEETAALLSAAMILAQILVAVFLSASAFGFWFPGRHLIAALPLAIPLVALGLRRAPRTGTLLALIGVASSVWLWLDVRVGSGGLVTPLPQAPLGPLVDLLPRFTRGSTYPFVLAGALAVAAVAALVLDSHRRGRRTVP
jgi:hypothetical protein